MTGSNEGWGAQQSKLRSLREKYDRESAALDLEYKVRRDVLKNPIRDAILEGLNMGMPQRKIYNDGLGMAQATQLYSFLGLPAASNAAKLKEHLGAVAEQAVESRVSPDARTLTVLSDTEFALVDSVGNRRNITYKRMGHVAAIDADAQELNEDELSVIRELRPAWSVLDKNGTLLWEPIKDMEAFMAYQANKGELIK